MIVSIHQKILLRKLLSKYGVNANKLCTQVNSKCVVTRQESRREISRIISVCTGKGTLFFLNHPYTMYFKSHRSTIKDSGPRPLSLNIKKKLEKAMKHA